MDDKQSEIRELDFKSLLLETMAEGVFTVNKSGKITSWNPAMERIAGFTAQEAIGAPCSMLNFHRCFGRSCPSGIKECGIYKEGKIDGRECYIKHKNGDNVPVLKSARILRDKNGAARGVVETVTNLTELHEARRAAEEANLQLGEKHRLDKIIGKSSQMQEVFFTIRACASSNVTVLIQGESGTGKELVAGAVHFNSPRSQMPFVTVNCSALSESILESELFGHAKGAFTNALIDRPGRFEEAEGGTIFLDEIGDISSSVQVKLLRVLQEREVERVGESKKRKVNIRVITATNRDLYGLVKNGSFREDLYYRLKVFPINLPPLRDRKKDIPMLISHFINLQNQKTGKQINGITQPAMRIILDYQWPGNVRELENAIEHAFVLCSGAHIDIFDLPVEIRRMDYHPIGTAPLSMEQNPRFNRQKITPETLLQVLKESDWNKAEAARRTGYSRASVWKYMKKWDIPLEKP